MRINIMYISVFAIIFYISYFASAFTSVSGFSFLIYCIMDIQLLLYNYKLRLKGGIINTLPYEGKALILFYIISVPVGCFFALDLNTFLIDSIKGIHYCVLFILVYIIVKQERNMDSVLIILGIVFFLYGITAILNGDYILDRLMISERAHPNGLGLNMVIGLILCCYFFSKNWHYKVIVFSFVPIAMYCLIESGSRKSLITFGIFLALAVFLTLLPSITKMKARDFLVGSLVIVAIITVVYTYYLPMYENSVLYQRLNTEYNDDGSAMGRVDMYRTAIAIFKEYPLFGIGYNSFKYYSKHGGYAHSTYGEVLSCSGIIGSVIYFSIYISILLKYIKLFFTKFKNKKPILTEGIVVSYLLSNFILMSTNIDIYHQYFFVLLGCFVAYYELEKDIIYQERTEKN